MTDERVPEHAPFLVFEMLTARDAGNHGTRVL
jgi:hypothetical protein